MTDRLNRVVTQSQNRTTENPPSELSQTQRLLGQAVRGPLDLAVVPPALLGLGALGIESGIEAVTPFDDVNLGSDFLLGEVQRVNEINTDLVESIGDFFGQDDFRVGPPQDWLEQLVNLGTGALVGGGSTIGKAVGLAAPTSRAGKVAVGTLEAITPVTQGFSTGRVAANTLVPFAATEALGEFVEPEGGDSFESLVDVFQGQDPLPRPDPSQGVSRLDDTIDRIERRQNNSLSSTEIILGGAATLLAAAALRRGFNSRNLIGSTIESGTPNQPRTIQSATTLKEQIITENQNANYVIANQQDRVVQELADQGLISPAMRDALDAGDLAARMDQATRIGGEHTTQAFLRTGMFPGSTKRTVPLRDWQREYINIRGDFSRPVQGLTRTAQEAFDARAKDFGTRRAALDYAMFGADSADQRAIARAASGDPTRRPSLTSFTDGDIRVIRDYVANDTQLSALSNGYGRLMNDMVEYAVDNGVLTKQRANALLRAHPNFMPNELGVASAPNTVEKIVRYANAFWKGVPEADTFQDLPSTLTKARSIETGGGIQNALDPGAAAEIYVNSMMRFVLNNGIRRDFIKTMELAKQLDPQNQFAKSFKEVDQLGPNVIKIMDNGEARLFEFDPLVASSLRFAPFIAKHQLLNATRQIKQFTTTGPLAPLFGIARTIWWDPLVASIQRQPGRATTKLDKLTQQLTGGRTGLRLGAADPSAVLGNLYGAGQDLMARFRLDMSSRIVSDLNNRSGLFSQFNETTMRHVAHKMRAAYETSPRGILDRYGTFNLGIMEEATTNGLAQLRSADAQIKSHLGIGRGSQVINSMRSMIEALHNGSRIRFFAENYKPDMSPKEVRKLVQETRNIVGDFSKRGLGKVEGVELQATNSLAQASARLAYRGATKFDPTRLAVEGVPYANTVLQAMTRFGQALTDPKTAPFAMSAIALGAVTPAIGGLVMSANLGEEYLDYFWNKRPGWLRGTSAYIPIPGLLPEEGIEMPIAPEVAWVVGPTLAGFAAATGMDGSRHISDPFFNDVKESAGALFGFMVPPIVQGGLNAAGQKADLGFDPVTGNFAGLREVVPEQITGAEVGKNPNSLVSANVEEMINAFTGTAGSMFLSTVTAGAQGPQGAKDAGTQLAFEAGKRLGPATGPLGLMGAYTFTSNKSQQIQKVEKIERIIDIATKSGLNRGVSSQQFPLAIGPVDDTRQLSPVFLDAAIPYMNAFAANSVNRRMIQMRSALNKQRVQHRANYPHDGEWLKQDRVIAENIQYIDEQLLSVINSLEQEIGIPVDSEVFEEPFLELP